MKIIKSIGFIALFFGLYTSAWATIWHVPSQCPNIQAGIDSALTGDTVLVADGTYTGEGNYNIDFLGKAILVTSENGPDTTIIDCEEISMHRAFIFHNGETSSSVLRGFTIQYGSHDEGGNIYCTNSSPTIEGNIIRTGCCIVGLGGGIYCDGTSSPLIADNIFELNYAQGGGAILCTDSAAPTIINNLFLSNNSIMGGGVFCQQSSSPSIMNSTFTSNGATSAGGAIWVFTTGSPTTVTNCILWDDWAPNGPEIWIQGGSAVVTYSDVEGGWSGDGNINSDPLFVSGPGSFSNYYLSQTAAGQPEQSPCVDAGDTSFIVPEAKTTRTDRYPDEWPIDMGYHYVSNYAPDLVDAPDTSIAETQYLTFTLEASDPDDDSIVFSSPNLPAGATLDSATGVFEWTPTNGQAGEYTITFIATDDGTPPLADTEYTDITVTSPGVDEAKSKSLSPFLFQNCPNPFVSTTIIKYSVITPIHIRLSIYNVCGELVWRLVNENQETGLYEVVWDGCDHQGYKLPSGIYFCYLESDEFKDTRRMLIVR